MVWRGKRITIWAIKECRRTSPAMKHGVYLIWHLHDIVGSEKRCLSLQCLMKLAVSKWCAPYHAPHHDLKISNPKTSHEFRCFPTSPRKIFGLALPCAYSKIIMPCMRFVRGERKTELSEAHAPCVFLTVSRIWFSKHVYTICATFFQILPHTSFPSTWGNMGPPNKGTSLSLPSRSGFISQYHAWPMNLMFIIGIKWIGLLIARNNHYQVPSTKRHQTPWVWWSKEISLLLALSVSPYWVETHGAGCKIYLREWSKAVAYVSI